MMGLTTPEKSARENGAVGRSPPGDSPAPPTDKPAASLDSLAAEGKRLARRREEELQKMLAFQLAQREADQKHEDAR